MSQRLAWVEARDLEDRSEWVSKFRESSKALSDQGDVGRHAHWMLPGTCHGVTRTETGRFPPAVPPFADGLGQASQW